MRRGGLLPNTARFISESRMFDNCHALDQAAKLRLTCDAQRLFKGSPIKGSNDGRRTSRRAVARTASPVQILLWGLFSLPYRASRAGHSVCSFCLHASDTAYIHTQQAIEALAVGNNARAKLHAEAQLLAQQAEIALETARNSAVRTKAEADIAEAEADKLSADALTLKQKAAYGDQKAGHGLTIKFEYQKRKAEAFAKLIELRNLLPRVKAETEKLEAESPLRERA